MSTQPPRRKRRNPLAILLVVLAALAATITVSVLVVSDEDGTPEVRVVAGVKLDEEGQRAYEQAVQENDGRPDREGPDESPHGDLSREVPKVSDIQRDPDASPAEKQQAVAVATDPEARAEAIDRSQDQAQATTSGSDDISDPQTSATPTQRGCRTRFVQNRSSRNGARPALLVMHYTVSPNRPGRGDVDGITAYFNNPRAQASSNYIVDEEGHCNYVVSEQAKAWTQGFFNPWSISWEVINTGRENDYIGPANGAGLRKLGVLVSDSARRWGIPLRRARVVGCRVVVSGIIDHDTLPCGNFHTDIKPYSLSQVLAAAQRARGPRTVCPSVRKVQRKLNDHKPKRHHEPRLSEDGALGPLTRRALRRFQSAHKLPVTGRVDRPLRKELRIPCRQVR